MQSPYVLQPTHARIIIAHSTVDTTIIAIRYGSNVVSFESFVTMTLFAAVVGLSGVSYEDNKQTQSVKKISSTGCQIIHFTTQTQCKSLSVYILSRL